MISCKEAADFINKHLNQDLDEAQKEKLHEHIESCKHCHGHYEYDVALKKLIQKKGFKETLSDSFRESISNLLDRLD